MKFQKNLLFLFRLKIFIPIPCRQLYRPRPMKSVRNVDRPLPLQSNGRSTKNWVVEVLEKPSMRAIWHRHCHRNLHPTRPDCRRNRLRRPPPNRPQWSFGTPGSGDCPDSQTPKNVNNRSPRCAESDGRSNESPLKSDGNWPTLAAPLDAPRLPRQKRRRKMPHWRRKKRRRIPHWRRNSGKVSD